MGSNTHEHNLTTYRFVIDVDSKQIIKPEKMPKLVQGEHNSSKILFVIPKVIDEHDMSACECEIHFTNINTDTDEKAEDYCRVSDMTVNGDNLEILWSIPGTATKYWGGLCFSLKLSCYDEKDELEYQWNTVEFAVISVYPSINNKKGENIMNMPKNHYIDERVRDILAKEGFATQKYVNEQRLAYEEKQIIEHDEYNMIPYSAVVVGETLYVSADFTDGSAVSGEFVVPAEFDSRSIEDKISVSCRGGSDILIIDNTYGGMKSCEVYRKTVKPIDDKFIPDTVVRAYEKEEVLSTSTASEVVSPIAHSELVVGETIYVTIVPYGEEPITDSFVFTGSGTNIICDGRTHINQNFSIGVLIGMEDEVPVSSITVFRKIKPLIEEKFIPDTIARKSDLLKPLAGVVELPVGTIFSNGYVSANKTSFYILQKGDYYVNAKSKLYISEPCICMLSVDGAYVNITTISPRYVRTLNVYAHSEDNYAMDSADTLPLNIQQIKEVLENPLKGLFDQVWLQAPDGMPYKVHINANGQLTATPLEQ